MNRIKKTGALLLAIALILGVVIQSGIGGVLADNAGQSSDQTGQVAEPYVPVAEPIMGAVTEPAEAETAPVTEPTTVPAAEAVTEPTTASDAETTVTEPTAEPDDQPADATTEDTEDAGEGGGDAVAELSIYQRLMACGSLAEMDALLFDTENATAVALLTQDERSHILAHIEEIYALIVLPTEADNILKDSLITRLNKAVTVICDECGGENGAHNEGCSLLEPVCTCGGVDGIHTEDCPAYEPVCTCGSIDGVHAETCPLHVESYPWMGLTDYELAAWLMAEENAETVKSILSDETTGEYALLTLRIDAIMDGEDTMLAEQVIAYLTALMGMDEAGTLAEADEYIYFDLAAGNVTIGAKTYSGMIYVNGVETSVTGPHKAENKYYIYQSTKANRADTGYADDDAYTYKTGCRVPVYKRVMYDGKLWTEYITNNTDVYAVSGNWETAAKDSQREATSNWIKFDGASNYTANVIILLKEAVITIKLFFRTE